MARAVDKPTTRLTQRMQRTDRVLAILHAPSASRARMMEAAGTEAAFVGASGGVGAYTGRADGGGATMTACVIIAGGTARGAQVPVMMDDDTATVARSP